jgi:glycerol-3-phosphate dehydrogenase
VVDHTFSGLGRQAAWKGLPEEVFDLLVIGAGITGSGVARDAVGRGLRVALIDAGDLAAGTSSRSSRLVHGGLRYLETLEIPLVFEALRERRRLLQLAPHLVHPTPFSFPVYRGDPTGLAKLAAGMWLYESLSLFRSPRRHRILTRRRLLREEPGLRSDGLVGGAVYFDAQVDDARLTLSVARAAHEAGAVLVTYARAERIERHPDASTVVSVRDELGGQRTLIRARLVVNAGGPWSDRIRAIADPGIRPRLRLTKGVHFLVDRARVGNRSAIIFRSAVDGRVMFVLPWGDFTYVGTTDTEFVGDPVEAEADTGDVRYLLDSLNSIFPSARLEARDLLSTWAGIRPLLAPAAARGLTASQTSREHAIWRDPSGLLNVAGGKLTTYRSMAAEVVDEAAALLAREFRVASGHFASELVPLPGAPAEESHDLVSSLEARLQGAVARPTEVANHLHRRYGSDSLSVIELLEARPELAEPLVPQRRNLVAEVVHAVRAEMALTVEDVLRRRLHVFYETRDGGLPIAPRVAEVIRAEIGPAAHDSQQAQLEAYAEAVRRTRPWRGL